MRGQMLWFNEDKSYGFISTEDGERLYVQSSGFAAEPPVGRCAGQQVSLQLLDDDNGRRATDVTFVDVNAERRARPRRGVRG